MAHELSHHLEADRGTFNRAVAFLSRRTAGDPLERIAERGFARRDKFRNLKGNAQPYPGLVHEATRFSDAYGWHRATLTGSPAKPPLAERATAATTLAERATASTSTSARPKCSPWAMEWMWLDPVGFAAPEYFDFIWDTVVRGR